jgi:hypothetical protein
VWIVEGYCGAWIGHTGEVIRVGWFDDVEEGALAYDEARRLLNLPPVNFPEEGASKGSRCT